MRITGPIPFSQVFNVSTETLDRLKLYEGLLRRWQKTHNLVSSKSLPYLWERHFADSAQLLRFVRKPEFWLDIGSGAGFPGMVIAILTAASGTEVHLVESNQKKAAFLDTVRRETGLSVFVHPLRIEDAPKEISCSFDVISARALASLDKLCAYAKPFMKEKTMALFPEGASAQQDVIAVSTRWNLTYREHKSIIDPKSRILTLFSPGHQAERGGLIGEARTCNA